MRVDIDPAILPRPRSRDVAKKPFPWKKYAFPAVLIIGSKIVEACAPQSEHQIVTADPNLKDYGYTPSELQFMKDVQADFASKSRAGRLAGVDAATNNQERTAEAIIAHNMSDFMGINIDPSQVNIPYENQVPFWMIGDNTVSLMPITTDIQVEGQGTASTFMFMFGKTNNGEWGQVGFSQSPLPEAGPDGKTTVPNDAFLTFNLSNGRSPNISAFWIASNEEAGFEIIIEFKDVDGDLSMIQTLPNTTKRMQVPMEENSVFSKASTGGKKVEALVAFNADAALTETASVTVTPTPKQQAPTAEEISNMTQVELVEKYPDLAKLMDVKNPNSPIVKFANAFGIKPEEIGDLIPKLTVVDEKQSITLFDKNNVPLIVINQNEKGEWIIGEYGLKYSYPNVGGTVDFSDPNAKSSSFEDIVTRNFGHVTLTGAFMEEYWNYNGASYWSKFSFNHNTPFIINNFFFNFDKNPDSGAQDFIDARIAKMIETIDTSKKSAQLKKDFKNTPFTVVLAGEPYYNYNGQIIWQGELSNQPFLLHEELGKDWIIDAEVSLLQQFAAKGFESGTDFNVIGINLAGIELPGKLTNYTIDQVIRIKTEVFNRLDSQTKQALNITKWQDVPFDISAEFHLGETLGNRNVTLPLDKFDIDAINENVQNIEEKTGSKVHISELDGIGDPEQIIREMAALIKSGSFETITFFEPLKPIDGPQDPWQNILFDKNQKPTQWYYLLSKLLTE